MKFRVVLEVVTGAKRPVEICRELRITDGMLSRWRNEFMERGPQIFETDRHDQEKEQRIAELKRRIVEEMSSEYTVAVACQAVGLSRSTYYYKAMPKNDMDLLEAIETMLLKRPKLGYRMVTKYLQREDLKVNAKWVYRVMKEHDLVIRHTRKLKSTTQSDHPYQGYRMSLLGI